jgi:2-iminobutanoate/2-iminopropanoate deaminase
MTHRLPLVFVTTTALASALSCAHTKENVPMSDPSPVKYIASVPGLPSPPGYSYAAYGSGDVVFFAGQVPLDARGEVVGRGDFAAQARQTFANISRALAEAGCRPESILKISFYVVGLDRERLLALRTARDAFFPVGVKPASTLLGVAALFNPDVQIEIEVVALRAR